MRSVATEARRDFAQALAEAANRFDKSLAALVIAIAVITAAMAAYLVDQSGPPVVFFKEQASLYQISDTHFRRLFYTLFVAVGFAVFLAIGLLRPADRKARETSVPSSHQLSRMEKAWPILVIGFLIVTGLRPRIGDMLAALLLVYLVTQVLSGHIKTRTLMIALLLSATLLYLAPFAFTHLVQINDLWTMDTHWTSVLGPALFRDPFSNAAALEAMTTYGVLLNQTIAAINEALFAGTVGGAFATLKLFNIVFALLVAAIIAQRFAWTDRRLIVLGGLIVVLLFAAMGSNVARTFETPNQLPARFLCVVIAVALAPVLAGSSNLSGWLLIGFVSPALIAWNVEVGVQCLLALGFAMFLKAARDGIVAVIIGGVVFGVSFLVVGTALLVLLFENPLGQTLSDLGVRFADKAGMSSSGFGGTAYFIYVPFLVVMGHALIGFFGYLRNIRSPGPLTKQEFQGAVLVGLIIISGPYVMNRYAIWNMWIPMLLYVLWVLPKLAQPDVRMARVWAFIMIALAMPFAMGTPVTQIAKSFKPSQFIAADAPNALPCADGVLAEPELCSYLNNKAQELKQLGGGEAETLWLSSLTLMMHRLSNTDSAMSQRGLFFRGHRKELFDPLVADLIAHAPQTVLTDKVTTGNAAGIPQGVRDFQHRLVTRAGYKLADDGDYWHVYRKPGGQGVK